MPEMLLIASDQNDDAAAHARVVRDMHATTLNAYYRADITIVPTSGKHDMTIEQSALGAIKVMRIRLSNDVIATRTLNHIRACPKDVCLIWFVTSGQVIVEQAGRVAEIQSGSFAISSSRMPFRITSVKCADAVRESYQVVVPSYLLAELGDVSRFCARSYPLTGGSGSLAFDILTSLFVNGDGVPRDQSADLADAALKSIIIALKETPSSFERSSRNATFRQACDYVHTHLGEQGLTAAKVGAALGVSARYIYMMFKADGTSFHGYVWNNRLDRARQLLTGPLTRQMRISEVAFMLGFASSAHFSRSYKDRFGHSPRLAKHIAGEVV